MNKQVTYNHKKLLDYLETINKQTNYVSSLIHQIQHIYENMPIYKDLKTLANKKQIDFKESINCALSYKEYQQTFYQQTKNAVKSITQWHQHPKSIIQEIKQQARLLQKKQMNKNLDQADIKQFKEKMQTNILLIKQANKQAYKFICSLRLNQHCKHLQQMTLIMQKLHKNKQLKK